MSINKTDLSETEELQRKITDLEKENIHLKYTVSWMHDLIWDLSKQNRKNVTQTDTREETTDFGGITYGYQTEEKRNCQL